MSFNTKFTLALIASLVMVPLSFAQESADDENVEEVVVTGTRITNPNIVSTSQVQVVTTTSSTFSSSADSCANESGTITKEAISANVNLVLKLIVISP